ncbi:calcium-binding protein [Pelagimonas varians]|uniref:Bifunctional hemolysin/adenylate cyclase n=1 Tax=Pelagimonas varians TaxID=696760 RepID=A0A238KCY7_9RHOB|nr:calcium-binding protein [Pelagimonas varians]PYG29942.1 putative secreted protein (type I secretion substrate) [Pelagimonas varians]SMX40695.1 Bifunctional hemolysin/adenylate cyclase precursor [Pelagimonas varians]
MATLIDPASAQDVDQPLNTNPDYSVTHVFSTSDVTGTYDGLTQGDVLPGEMPVVDFSADPSITKEGVALYPVNSEFGFISTDFVGAVEKEFEDGIYGEGWVGDLTGPAGEQLGIVVSNVETDTFKTPALLGTWLSGLGGNTVKASTEHYNVMQEILSDQAFPDDPDAVYPLDNNLIVIGGDYDGQSISELLAGTAVDGDGNPITITDGNLDGVVDIKDILNPNESSIEYDIAASSDYSVTVKDDGKLLYRWGNTIKRPNDIRLEGELELPDEWSEVAAEGDLQPLFKITAAELVVHHTITNNPNDQIRPEDLENEAAIGTLPTYQVISDYNEDGQGAREVWVTTDAYYSGNGTLYEAGTILKDALLAASWAASDLAAMGAADGAEGFTNAWYTTMDREPFEPVLNEDGTEYVGSGPRWRLQPDKYGQDLPSVDIPTDPSLAPPPTKDELKYETGAETQTVINLLDWETDYSPMSVSSGWQNQAGTVSENGVNMSENFDFAVYIKGDIKPATVYSAELVMSYEEIEIFDAGVAITGGEDDDILAGQGNNRFVGGAGSDMFIVSYGARSAAQIVAGSVIADFTAGEDVLSLIGMGADVVTLDTAMATTNITQTVIGGDLSVSVDGVEVALLEGVTEELGAESFYTSTQSSKVAESTTITGTPGPDNIVGDDDNNIIYALAGDDTVEGGLGDDRAFLSDGDDIYRSTADDASDGDDMIAGELGDDIVYGGGGDDSIWGGDGNDLLYGSAGNDKMGGDAGNDTIFGGADNDTVWGGTGLDRIYLEDGNDVFYDDVETGVNASDMVAGGAGNDSIYGAGGDDRLWGESGSDYIEGGEGNDLIGGGTWADTLDGGTGNDTIIGGAGNDRTLGGTGNDRYEFSFGADGRDVISEVGGSGTDTLAILDSDLSELGIRRSGTSVVIEDVEGVNRVVVEGHFSGIATNRLDMIDANDGLRYFKTDLVGTASSDLVVGTSAAEIISGGGGNDIVVGGGSKDSLDGGAGADVFIYSQLSDSAATAPGRDTIYDFNQAEGDKIGLAALDANTGLAGDDSFTFTGFGPTSGAGTLSYTYGVQNTIIWADVDGGGADFSILLAGTHTLVADDFIL